MWTILVHIFIIEKEYYEEYMSLLKFYDAQGSSPSL